MKEFLRAKIFALSQYLDVAFADFRTGYCNSCRETADGRI